jgi:hypothetical protein
VNLLSIEDIVECLLDLANHLGLSLDKLSEGLMLLARATGGNPRHLEALLTAAAGFVGQKYDSLVRGTVLHTALLNLFEGRRTVNYDTVMQQVSSND